MFRSINFTFIVCLCKNWVDPFDLILVSPTWQINILFIFIHFVFVITYFVEQIVKTDWHCPGTIFYLFSLLMLIFPWRRKMGQHFSCRRWPIDTKCLAKFIDHGDFNKRCIRMHTVRLRTAVNWYKITF